MDVRVVRIQIGEIGTNVLEQSDVLACASEGGSAVVGGAHVTAQERSRRTRASGGMGDDVFFRNVMSLRVIALLYQQGARDGVIVQSRNVPQREGKVCRWLLVGRIEDAIFRGMLIGSHGDMESGFDSPNRSANLDFHSVA